MATVRERNGSYQIRVSVGYDASGKQIVKAKTWKPEQGMTTRQIEKELLRQIVEFEKKVTQGFLFDEKLTFEQYAQYVLSLKERAGVKRKTIEEYRGLLPRINAAIGHMKLYAIHPALLNNFYTDLAKEGQNKRQAASCQTRPFSNITG